MTIQWEEPPPRTRGVNRGNSWFFEALRAQPGQWARYPGKPRGLEHLGTRRPGFEYTTRTIDGEKVGYARYVGDQQVTSIEGRRVS